MKNILFLFLAIIAFPLIAQDYALQKLNDSPRHHEWVQLKSGERSVHAFVAYPEVSENAQAIIVIHENRGLTDWVRSFADQVTVAGYIAVAPDLLSEFDDEDSEVDEDDLNEDRDEWEKDGPTAEKRSRVQQVEALHAEEARRAALLVEQSKSGPGDWSAGAAVPGPPIREDRPDDQQYHCFESGAANLRLRLACLVARARRDAGRTAARLGG
jgi:hypothetical protein